MIALEDINVAVEEMMKVFSRHAPKATVAEYNKMYEACVKWLRMATQGPRL